MQQCRSRQQHLRTISQRSLKFLDSSIHRRPIVSWTWPQASANIKTSFGGKSCWQGNVKESASPSGALSTYQENKEGGIEAIVPAGGPARARKLVGRIN